MKFDCGLTSYEKYEARKQWHRWFAYRPVRIGTHDCRWLETVERKRNIGQWPGIPNTWEYRAVMI